LLVEREPSNPLSGSNSTIEALNTVTFKERLNETQSSDKDLLVIFYTNEGCPLCPAIWPVIEAVSYVVDSVALASVNMDLNELTYLDTMGSFPSLYPIVRYFKGKTKSFKDFDGL
jgi:thiol-disulfide isomerase/thioredoxin